MAPVLNRLAAVPGLRLQVLFAGELPGHRQWARALDAKFPYRLLPGVAVDLGRRGAPFVIRANPTLVREIRQCRPDVVVCTPFPALTSLTAFLLCRLTGIPFVLDIYTMQSESLGRRLLGPVLRGIARGCAGFVARSRRTVGYLVSLGVSPDRIHLAPHPVDYPGLRAGSRLAPADRARLRGAYGIGRDRVVLYVGRLVRRKGLAVLLEAFARVKTRCPETALVLVGEGYQRQALEEQRRRAGLADVCFTGPVAHADLAPLYGLADLFVLPSISTNLKLWGEETWGFVVGEAMACGLPVVVTDRVGCADDLVREGENGLVVPEKDPDRLARAMLAILEDDRLRARMGEASERLIQAFSYDRAAEGYRAAIGAVARKAYSTGQESPAPRGSETGRDLS